ncbi:MAG: GNAT family N-acetyltransferase [Caulobacteraceae bacterium]|nr:GNAT family N-acetyltransferase [Caulobacteraceae bacterium]
MEVEQREPGALSATERQLWAAFRLSRPELASPYFDLRYVLAAGQAAPGARIAVIRRRGRIVGFLPFPRRGGMIQPLAAPLTDYHGVVAGPGARIDVAAVVRALGCKRFRFSGLVREPARAAANLQPKPAMVADLTGGFDAYLERRVAAGQGSFLKDKRRRLRALERDHGPVAFNLSADPAEVLDLIVDLKREHMTRTGKVDVFACGWTVELIRNLAGHAEGDFGVRFAALRAGGRIIAAEVGLVSGEAYHLWFPVYDPGFARYSPGALMTLETLKALAAQGVRTVDFGAGAEDYKLSFAEPGREVFEGDVIVGGWAAAGVGALRFALAPAPAVKRQVKKAASRIDRRLDRITACEPRLAGRVGAASKLLTHVGRRHPRLASVLGVVALSAGAALLVE